MYSRGPVYILYSFFIALAFVASVPVYFIRLKLLRGEPLSLRHRLGLLLPLPVPARRSLWLHAVSVGEVLSLQKLIQELKSRHPDWALYFSVLTNSGMKMARQKMAACDRLFYVPFDFGWAVRRHFRALRPDLLVLAESELWPNLLRQGRKRTKGILVINGRMSDRSFRRYRNFRFFLARLLQAVTLFLVQTDQDRERFLQAGVDGRRIRVAGNLKCEISPPAFTPESLQEFRKTLSIPAGRKVLVAGSTRRGEEEQLLLAFREARRLGEGGPVHLVLAPRHLDRVPEVIRACREAGLDVRRRTEVREGDAWDILLLDTIGELARVYALCDAAFIGGSLVPWGGHNLLEPAFYGKPVFFGPHMRNFAYLAERFVEAGAARVVRSAEDLRAMFLLQDEAGLEAMGRTARRTLESLQGATQRTVEAIEGLMS